MRATPGELGSCDSGVCVSEQYHARAAEPCSGTCRDFDTPGTCDRVRSNAGEPPDDLSLLWCYASEGLVCLGATGARTCQPPVPVGGSCADESSGCEDGAYCDSATRTCMAQRTSGPCAEFEPTCARAAACDKIAEECVPRLKHDGQECIRMTNATAPTARVLASAPDALLSSFAQPMCCSDHRKRS